MIQLLYAQINAVKDHHEGTRFHEEAQQVVNLLPDYLVGYRS